MAENLKPLPINELLNKQFFIPHYQRGYRWTNLQVEQLLDDIESFSPKETKGSNKTFYCLQPVVVKLVDDTTKLNNKLDGVWYEVIDGQQRLTTIYIILQYINQKWQGEDKIPQFKLNFETRVDCIDFLPKLKINPDNTVDIVKSNIDFFHISQALQTIRHWQLNYPIKNGKPLNTANFQSTFFEFSKVIWYEVSAQEKSQVLFERLNLGKIPLTNAELTKALFLSSESFKSLSDEERRIKQYEIARIWDEMEHRLNEPDEKFWSFITNKKREEFDTKIELVLDIISGKKDDQLDTFYTFLEFSKKQKKGDLSEVWEEIEQCYNILLEWFIDRDHYHKIGYLVASKHFGNYEGVDLGQLVKDSMSKPKLSFIEQVDNHIKDSVKVEISELRYENHYNQIFNVLLLFNVETNRTSKAITEYYPFKQHKDNNWSLEHIHARKSENFEKNKKEPWIIWLKLHLPILEEMLEVSTNADEKEKINKAIDEINKYNNLHLQWERFEILFKEVNQIFTLDPVTMDRESEGLSNLALLSQPNNSALNNSVFEIKRREIINLDKNGNFIPVCTRRVFMKYYNQEGIKTQHYFWSESDREKYISELKAMLNKSNFLPINHIDDDTNDNQ